MFLFCLLAQIMHSCTVLGMRASRQQTSMQAWSSQCLTETPRQLGDLVNLHDAVFVEVYWSSQTCFHYCPEIGQAEVAE